MGRTVMISAGESSGELYGALLAEKLRESQPDIKIIGIGGYRMKQAGVELISGISSAFGLTEALWSIFEVRRALKKAKDALLGYRPDILVLIDYPDFNFMLGRRAKELGIKVLYYVSPQVWAWRRGRINQMSKFVDRLALLLPFEVDVYKGSGIDCEFVGHPAYDEMRKFPKDKIQAKTKLGLDGKTPIISLLPGSRRSELRRHLDVMCEFCSGFKSRHPEFGFVVPIAPDIKEHEYAGFERLKAQGAVLTRESSYTCFAASDGAVIASGTASLQAAFMNLPHVIIYRVSPFTYAIGKRVLNVRYINLSNLILDKEAVPELIQKDANAANIERKLSPLLFDAAARESAVNDLMRVTEIYEGKGANSRVARMVGETAGWSI